MPLMTWKDEYSVKIAEFDGHHKQLIGMINDLDDAMRQGKGKIVVGDILKKLINYTGFHFAAEEKIFKQHDYPEYVEHKDKHDKMTAKVLALQNDYNAGKVSLTVEVSKFLTDWLNKHIKETDQRYSEHLNSKGIK
ncbi:MAG: hemerythrin family protein [Candidatus Kuenenia stuttgartiensis]|jgi:hemerythrin|uniref:Hemerythrin-like domain-containing protein n=1 Tax=Kuenenia stuttgartiensis TaxID=174633 RepID=A0A2C9CCS2_KUEST|nr:MULTISPECIES: bacteriohemerythrin [Kuenenia]MBE7547557.1 hemerythrin family protein [Planctomycetia bacterium]MBW7941116.1 hemerythrin family protein [Candidatus Kuenenia stuttgartiensis]MBZ0193271.1 bacteriohemerythrin [Candidatus Kuenenia stuttgartiensis]MCZ7624306.1 bacteriohemerythrin [Candidatus Kuenenia sp.]TVM02451.1 MAG: hemerythrin [Candidatus Kuenenia stuttgartiensis]